MEDNIKRYLTSGMKYINMCNKVLNCQLIVIKNFIYLINYLIILLSVIPLVVDFKLCICYNIINE